MPDTLSVSQIFINTNFDETLYQSAKFQQVWHLCKSYLL